MRLVLEPRAEGALSAVVERLGAMGYARVPTVTEVAQFSVRGGIIDVYGFGMAGPARIEWWGDEIVSLRGFDLDTQRSGDAIERITVLPVRTEAAAPGAPAATTRSSLLELLPADAIFVVEQESAVEREVVRAWEEAAHHLEVARRLGEELPEREQLWLDPSAWGGRLAGVGRVSLGEGGGARGFPAMSPESWVALSKRVRRGCP